VYLLLRYLIVGLKVWQITYHTNR